MSGAAGDSTVGRDGNRRSNRATISAFAALVALVAVLTQVAGVSGTAAGLATAVTWYVAGTPFAIAAGYLVLATTWPAETTATTMVPRSVGVITLAFLTLVLAPIVRSDQPLTDATVVLASAGGLGGAAWYLGRSHPLWVAAGAMLGLGTLAAYALHRYELVQLGLVPELESESGSEPAPEEHPDTDSRHL